MRQNLLIVVIALSLTSCIGANNVYKNTVLDYLQTENGIKTDFKIEFTKFELSNITVVDSVKILNDQFQTEKTKKNESAQQIVTHWEKAIEKQLAKGDDLVAKALVSNYQGKLKEAKEELQRANEWEPDYIHKYEGRSSSEVLAKKADTYFSFQNPQLAQPVRQELGAIFILSPDGTQCYKMIKGK